MSPEHLRKTRYREDPRSLTRDERATIERGRVYRRLYDAVLGAYDTSPSESVLDAGLRFWVRCGGHDVDDFMGWVKEWRSAND